MICISRAAIAVTVLLAAVSIEPLFAWMELPQATAQLTKPAEDGEPGGADDFFSRGMQRWAKGDLQGAHSDFTRAIEIDPKHWHAYFRRALGLSAMKPEQALDDFGKAIELNPAHYNAYVSRSTLLRGRGDYRGAKADLDAAIALEPGNPAAYSNRAIIYWETGSNEEALLDMNKSIELQPDVSARYLVRGFVLASLRQFPAAYEDFDHAFKLDPNLKNGRQADPGIVDHYTQQGTHYAGAGDLDRAMTELNKAIVLGGPPRSISSLQANPRLKSIASALGHRGLIWLRKGNEIEARRDLVDCLKLNPCARPRLEDQMRSSGMQQYLNSILPPPDKQETACVQKAGDGFLFAGSKDVVTPVALATPKPRYTEEARRARKQGTVVIQFVVRKDGTAANFRVIKGLGFGLDESAINTIAREWRFKPGTYKGDPADVQIIVEMLFKLF